MPLPYLREDIPDEEIMGTFQYQKYLIAPKIPP